jgi:Fe2+ or Zn2+ uptake regulation protein
MLADVGGHQSADELVAVLRDAGYPHARTTVYNALADLARAGVVREAPVTAGALRYEADTSPHHHFVCRVCGVLMNVPVSDDRTLPPYPVIGGIQVDAADVVYRGLCKRCSRAGVGTPIDLRDEADLREVGAEQSVGAVEHHADAVSVVRGETPDRL